MIPLSNRGCAATVIRRHGLLKWAQFAVRADGLRSDDRVQLKSVIDNGLKEDQRAAGQNP